MLSPRSFRNPRTRENFVTNTGVGFDYLNVSSSIINHVFTFMLNPERLNRVNQQHVLGKNNFGIKEYLDMIGDSVFDLKKLDNYEMLIKKNIISLFIDQLFISYIDGTTDEISKSILLGFINETRESLIQNNDTFNNYLISKIDSFISKPELYESIEKTKVPDGSPIGNFSCDY